MTIITNNKHLLKLFSTGNLTAFKKDYELLQNPISDDIHFLAAKVFQEAGNWKQERKVLAFLKENGKGINRLKASLMLDSLDFVLERQSRHFANQILLNCDQLIKTNQNNDFFHFIATTKIRIEASLITLGLANATQKSDLLARGSNLLVKSFDINSEEAWALLGLLMNFSLANPLPNPALTLKLYEENVLIGKNQLPTALNLSTLFLSRAKAILRTHYYDRDSVKSDALPEPLIQIKADLNNVGYVCGEDLLAALYGSHLLDLDFVEGIGWIEKSISKIWYYGHYHIVDGYKRQCLFWLDDRAQVEMKIRLQQQFEEFENEDSSSLQKDLQKLHQSHQYFTQGDYEAGEKLLKEYINHMESETSRVHFVSLAVNSKGRIESDRKGIIKIIESEIARFKGQDKSLLLAQLYTFKAIAYKKERIESYQLAISLYEELGLYEEVVNQQINKFLEIIQMRRLNKENPVITDDLVKDLKKAELYITDNWFKYPLSATANIFEAYGKALFLAEKYDLALEFLENSVFNFREAGHLRGGALSTNYLVLVLINLGRIHNQLSHYDQAIEQGYAALDILEKSDLVDFVWRMEFHLALAYSEPINRNLIPPDHLTERRVKATNYFWKALNTYGLIFEKVSSLPSSERLNAFSELNASMRQMIFSGFYFFLAQKDLINCIEWLEMCRSKSLVAAIAKKIEFSGARNPLVDTEQALRKSFTQLSSIRRQRKLEEELFFLYEKMKEKEELHDYAARMQRNIPKYSDILKTIQKEEEHLEDRQLFFLYYYTYQNEIYSFGISSVHEAPLIKKIPLSTGDMVNEINTYFQSGLGYDGSEPINEKIWAKFSALIAPLKQWTRPGDIICIIPYGELHDLPYHALLLDDQPLISRNPIFYNTSLASWEYLNAKNYLSSPGVGVSVFGNPESNLEKSAQEAEVVAEELGTKAVLGLEAAKEQFLMAIAKSSIVHFAGHGTFEKRKGLQSAIYLNDGKITAEEIMNQISRSDLITLSACDTGRHFNHPGEERVGLVSAFLSAGSKSVIASLWPVVDSDAKALFSIFYKKLKPNKPKVIALQESMIEMMKQGEQYTFFNWGSYVLHGNWR